MTNIGPSTLTALSSPAQANAAEAEIVDMWHRAASMPTMPDAKGSGYERKGSATKAIQWRYRRHEEVAGTEPRDFAILRL